MLSQEKGRGLSRLLVTAAALAGLAAVPAAAYSRGVTAKIEQAGIEKNSLGYFKLLSSLNIRPYMTPSEQAVGDAFQVCKRRWLSSPYGVWEKFTTVTQVKSTMTTGDKKNEKMAIVTEQVYEVGEDMFGMSISIKADDGENQDSFIEINRNEYIVTCLETIEKQREMDALLKMRYHYDEPYLATHETDTDEYRLMVNTVTIKGTFPDGGTFQRQNVTGSAHFWTYAKGLNNSEASLITGKDGTIQGIMQLDSYVLSAYNDQGR